MSSNNDRKLIEPLTRALYARALQLGYRKDDTSYDADAHEIVDCALKCRDIIRRPFRQNKRVVLFKLDGLQTPVFLTSPAGRPCDYIGPFVDDRRRLGLLVGRLTLIHVDHDEDIQAHLSAHGLPGWNAPEVSQNMRWTTGHAELPIHIQFVGQIPMLAVEIVSTGPKATK